MGGSVSPCHNRPEALVRCCHPAIPKPVVRAAANIAKYTIDITTGLLMSVGTVATGQNPTSITIHPSGKFAYVTNSGSNDVWTYAIDATTGNLTLIGTVGT